MSGWDATYGTDGKVWGEDPSVIAKVALEYLRENGVETCGWRVLDIGCGYGRDAFYLAAHLGADVLGVDVSESAIDMARGRAAESGLENVAFRQTSFSAVGEAPFDMVLVANLYHLLQPRERQSLADSIRLLTKAGSLVLLNALSVGDPEEYGLGESVTDDPHSFVGDKYRHFATRDELTDLFDFLQMQALYEHSYDEPHANGAIHHHIGWMMVGRR